MNRGVVVLLIVGIAVAVIAFGLAVALRGGGGSAQVARKSQEQSFGPVYPNPPQGRAVRVDQATLSQDKLTLTIGFVGAKGYLASDPCSEDYVPWVGPNGDKLDLQVVELAQGFLHRLPGTGCTLEGYLYVFHLALAVPFTGTTVTDLAPDGGALLVAAPPSVATVTAGTLPAGWTRRTSLAQEPGPPPTWVQVFAAADIEQPFEGPGRLVLYQAFGPLDEWSGLRAEKSRERGGAPIAVSVHGQQTPLWVDKSTGELLLAWTLDGDSLGLIGNSADLTPDQLVTIAEGISIPGG